MRRLIALALALISMLTLSSACAKISEEEKALQFDQAGQRIHSRRQSLEIPILREEFRSLEPAQNQSYALRAIGHQLYEGLTSLSAHGQLRYLLADAIEANADKTVWTIRLNKLGRWSDGSPVTASDFTETWLERLDPTKNCPTAFQAYMIEGAEAYHRAGGRVEDIGIRIEGDDIVIRLNQAYANFAEWLSQDFFLPAKSQEGNALYNGAFVLSSSDDQRLELKAQEYYWQSSPGGIETIHFNYFDDDIMAYESYIRGEQDIIGLPFLDIPYARRESASRRPDAVQFPLSAVSVMSLNPHSPFTQDKKSRHLLYEALDIPFLSRAIRYDQSTAVLAQQAPDSQKRQELMAAFAPLREKYEKELAEPLTVLVEGKYLSYREMIAEAKQWLDLYKLKVRVFQAGQLPAESRPDLIYHEIIYGSSDQRDLFWFQRDLEARFGLDDPQPMGIYPSDLESCLENLLMIPVLKLTWANLVQATVEGYTLPANGMPQLSELSFR